MSNADGFLVFTAAVNLHFWNQAVASFRAYFDGAKPTKEENAAAQAQMNSDAWDWCDRSIQGHRPKSPYAVAHGC